MTETGYSIKDLEKLSGIKAHTIRIWEKRYNVISPERTETNIRRYSNDDLKLILNISLLNRNGYKISEISGKHADEIAQLASSVTQVNNDDESLHEQLLASLIGMNENLFNKAVAASVARQGFEATIADVLFPFLHKIGIMWQVGTINPAQEHFLSNLVRQKIIAATDGLSAGETTSKETVLLFLPENELHEIGLLFYNYVFRTRGYPTVYLGTAVPYDNIERILEICDPKIVVTSMTNAGSKISITGFLKKLAIVTTGRTVYCTGPLTDHIKEQLQGNILFTAELLELLGFKKNAS